MPLTLPAHAAAILPIHAAAPRLFHPTALVVGAAVPDFAYVLGINGIASHSVRGLFTFCVPVGLLLLYWAEIVLLPALRATAPRWFGVEWARFFASRGPPRVPRDVALAVVAILIGAATHVLWDGFTHARQWPARVLYRDVMVGELSLARVLQHSSSVVGSIIVIVWWRRRYATSPAAPGPGAPRAFAVILGLTSVAWLSGVLLRVFVLPPAGRWPKPVWHGFWTGVAFALPVLTLACAFYLLRAGAAGRRLRG